MKVIQIGMIRKTLVQSPIVQSFRADDEHNILQTPKRLVRLISTERVNTYSIVTEAEFKMLR